MAAILTTNTSPLAQYAPFARPASTSGSTDGVRDTFTATEVDAEYESQNQLRQMAMRGGAQKPQAAGNNAVQGQPQGGNQDVSQWPLDKKLGVVIDEAVRQAGPEVGAKLKELTSPSNLAMMGAGLGVWLGSHAFGVGQVADVVMLVAGGIALGSEVLTVAKDFSSMLTGLATAKTTADLAQAGQTLARIVATVGVDTVLALVARKGMKSGQKLKKNDGPISLGLRDRTPNAARTEPVKPPVAPKTPTQRAVDHMTEPGKIVNRGVGINGGHYLDDFMAALNGQGKIVSQQPVPGMPGAHLIQYKLFKIVKGQVSGELKESVFAKTVFERDKWPREKLSQLANRLFGGIEGNGTHEAKQGGTTFIGWIRDGNLHSFGVKEWTK